MSAIRNIIVVLFGISPSFRIYFRERNSEMKKKQGIRNFIFRQFTHLPLMETRLFESRPHRWFSVVGTIFPLVIKYRQMNVLSITKFCRDYQR